MSSSGLEANLVLKATDAAGPALDAVKKQVSSLDAAVQILDRAMAAVSKTAKSIDPLASSVSNAEKAFAAQREAVQGLKEALEGATGPIDSATAAQSKLAMETDRAAAALAAQARTGARAAREMGDAITRERSRSARPGTFATTLAENLPFAGPALLGVAKKEVTAGADLAHAEAQMAGAGVSPEIIAAAKARSLELSGKYPNVSQTQAFNMFKELRSVVTKPEEALQIFDPLVAAASVLNARDPSGELSSNLTDLVKGAENIGAAKDPQRLVKLIDGWTKAMQVMGHTITPEGVYELDKRSKSAGASLSDRFLMTTGMSLSQEMGGDSAGNAVSMLYKQLAGGFQNSHGALKEFVRLGLIKNTDVDWLKNGEAKGLRAGVTPSWLGQAAADPDYFMWNTVVPAMRAHGYGSDAQIKNELRRLFPNSSEADLATKLFVQREQYAAHAGLYEQATGLAGAGLNAQDPIASFHAFTTQLENLAATVTSPIMKDAAGALDSMARSIGSWSQALSQWQKDHPEAAKAAGLGAVAAPAAAGGWLTWKLLSGLGGFLGFGGTGGASSSAVAGGGAGALLGAITRMSPALFILEALDALANTSSDRKAALMSDQRQLSSYAGGVINAQPGDEMHWRSHSYEGLIPRAPQSSDIHVSGDARGEVTVRVEPGSELLRVVEQVKRLSLEFPLTGRNTGRMDSDASPARGIGHQ